MAGLGFAAIGDFALDEDVGEVAREQVADASREFTDGKNLAGGLEIECELAHFEWSVVSCPFSCPEED